MLNLVGISYGYWNNSLDINTLASTGNIDAYFCGDYELDVIQGKGELDIDFNGEDELIISGTIYVTEEEEGKYKGNINYCVENGGTIPIKFDSRRGVISIPSEDGNGGLKLNLNGARGIIKPNRNKDLKLLIEASSPGRYNFEINLPYEQFIK